jgi:hypothetical protein
VDQTAITDRMVGTYQNEVNKIATTGKE